MKKPKNTPTPIVSSKKTLADRIFGLKIFFIFTILVLIVSYSLFIRDYEQWTYIKDYGIKVPLRYSIHGIDVSHHNSKIEWSKIKSTKSEPPISFCFIKATEGTNMIDQDFKKNWKGAKKAGFIRGAYHFYVPSANPIAQAKNFIRTVRLEEGDFVPVVDFELHGTSRKVRKNLVANVTTFIEYLKSHYQVTPIIYTNRNIYRQYVKDNFKNYPLWISDYNSTKLEDYESSDLILWQYSTAGHLKGIKGDVDFNVFVASESHLDDICIK